MKLGICLAFLLCVASTCFADTSCEFSSGKDKYDFKDLGTITYKEKKFDYQINLCEPVDCDAPPAKKAAVCQQTGQKSFFSCGTAQSQSIKEVDKNKLEFTFSGGTPCKNADKTPRSSVITLECSKGTKYKVTDSGEDKNCIYTFTIESEYACASSSGGGSKTTDDDSSSSGGGGGGLDGGWIFLIIVLCLAVVYVGGGMAWNYKRNELRGTEMIPNRDMWTSLPGLVKDGCIFTAQKVSCGRVCGDYEPL